MLANLLKLIIYSFLSIIFFKIVYELWHFIQFAFFVKRREDTALPKSFESKLIGRNNETLVIAQLSNLKQMRKAITCFQESFAKDPLWNFFLQDAVPDDTALRKTIMEQEYKVYLESKFSEKLLLFNQDYDVVSAAIWYDSENFHHFTNPYDDWKQKWVYISNIIKEYGILKGIKKLSTINDKATFMVDNFLGKKVEIMKDYFKEGFFFIYAIGTLPSCQGRGLKLQIIWIPYYEKYFQSCRLTTKMRLSRKYFQIKFGFLQKAGI